MNSQIETKNQRRSFIKKSAAGVVVTSLPAKSVWGACNASGISGGSGSTATCELPILSNGRSPGSWSKFLSNNPTKVGRNKIKTMFSTYQRGSNSALDNVYCQLHSYIMNTTITLSNGGAIPAATLNLGAALGSPGGIWNLAAFYLNAKLGFYTIPMQFSDADELIEHVWSVLYISNNGYTPTNFDSLNSSFTDGVSSISLSNLATACS